MGHFINETLVKNNNFKDHFFKAMDIFLPSSWLFMFLAIIITLFSFIFVFFLVKLSRKIDHIKISFYQLTLNFLRQEVPILKNSSIFGLFFLFFNLFFFIITLILSNNIKTEKVIVDKENLLYSKAKILSTKKEGRFYALKRSSIYKHRACKA